MLRTFSGFLIGFLLIESYPIYASWFVIYQEHQLEFADALVHPFLSGEGFVVALLTAAHASGHVLWFGFTAPTTQYVRHRVKFAALTCISFAVLMAPAYFDVRRRLTGSVSVSSEVVLLALCVAFGFTTRALISHNGKRRFAKPRIKASDAPPPGPSSA